MDQSSVERRLIEMSGRSDLRIPAYPAVLARITRIVGRHEYAIDELSKAVQSDQALTAAVLRYANSAKNAPTAPILSLDRAISHIGAKELVRCAIAGSLGAAATAPGPLVSLRHQVWKESLLSASIAQELAAQRGLAPETAFLAGLLHDFGKVVLLAALDHKGSEPVTLPADQWLNLIEKFHVEAGLRAAREWRLPPAIVEVIRAHHGATVVDAGHKPLVQIVQLSDHIVAIAERNMAVTEDDLRAIKGLGTSECGRIALALPGIVEMVASFGEPERAATPAGISWVTPAVRQDGPSGLVSFAATCERREGPLLFMATRVDWQSLRVTGRFALTENCLVKMILHLPTDISLTMNVISDVLKDGEHEIHLRPFALHGDAKTAYHAMITAALKVVPPSKPQTPLRAP